MYFVTDYLRAFATDIATTLNVDNIQLHMVQYGLLTRDQQDYLSNPIYTACAKGQKLCTIILSFNEGCVEKFLQCLTETSYYEPHRELLQKIRCVIKCTLTIIFVFVTGNIAAPFSVIEGMLATLYSTCGVYNLHSSQLLIKFFECPHPKSPKLSK